MRRGLFLSVAVLIACASAPALAQPPSSYVDAKDRMLPEGTVPQWGFWNGRPWWWALGECAAWHRTVKTMNTTKQPDDRMMDFVSPMLDQIQKDRGIKMDEAMVLTRRAMDNTMNERVSVINTTMGAAMLDSKCDALLAAYKKLK